MSFRFAPVFLLCLQLCMVSCQTGTPASSGPADDFKPRPIDNRSKDLALPGHHYPFNEVDSFDRVPIEWKKPAYPREILVRGGKGTVQAAIVVDASGRISQSHVIYADDERFYDSARLAFKEWRYTPARKNGRNVSVWGIIIIHFDIKERYDPRPKLVVLD